ncbi:MAG: HAD family hydrolase [Planctomycetes bacterium]|nr:HAD family hydrolase [Planctomycetota bacterium]
MRVVIDFDGTIVEHAYPDIGAAAPLALETIKFLKRQGCWLGLFTVRSGAKLEAAVAWLKKNGIEFDAVNSDERQKEWTTSPKMYGDVYIDDRGLGCPVLKDGDKGAVVNWAAVRSTMELLIEAERESRARQAAKRKKTFARKERKKCFLRSPRS